MKGDQAMNFRILMISKECNGITSQQIDGVTDGASIVSAMMATTSMLKQDAFLCFVCTYEIPMYDFDAESGDPPSEWEERQFAAKTLNGLIKHIRTDLNVEE